jgi:hypothetical protein
MDWLLSGMEDVDYETPTGTIQLSRWTFTESDMERVQKFMARLAKGFLRHLFPKLDTSKVECFARHIHNQSILSELKPITDRLKYDERGIGVIRFGYATMWNESGSGAFLFTFYNNASFIVFYSNRTPRPWDYLATSTQNNSARS